MVLMLGMIFFSSNSKWTRVLGDGEDGSIHGRVEKVSEDEKGGIGNNTRCCVGQVGGYVLFGCLRLSLTHTQIIIIMKWPPYGTAL